MKEINNRFFFSSSQVAAHRITEVFDLFWPLVAGFGNLRDASEVFFENYPKDIRSKLGEVARRELVNDPKIHGINLYRIVYEYSWEHEEEFLAEILLIYATAIFDDWAENFVKETLPHCSNNKKKDVIETIRQGEYDPNKKVKVYDSYMEKLSCQLPSEVHDCFKIKTRKKKYNDNLIRLYRYFKACRNCIAHGDKTFSKSVAHKFQEVRYLKAEDFGMKEIPKMACSEQGEPFRLYLRGVVGFYDVLIRIIAHLDKVAAERKCFDNQLCIQWQDLLKQMKMDHKDSKDIKIAGGEGENCVLLLSKAKDKLEIEHRISHFFDNLNSYNANVYEPVKEKCEQIYEFLKKKGCIKEVE